MLVNLRVIQGKDESTSEQGVTVRSTSQSEGTTSSMIADVSTQEETSRSRPVKP